MVVDTVATWEEASKVVTSNISRAVTVVAATSSSNKPVDTRKARLLRDTVPPPRQDTTPMPLQLLMVHRATMRTLLRHGLRRVTGHMVNNRLEWIPTHMRRESRGATDRVA